MGGNNSTGGCECRIFLRGRRPCDEAVIGRRGGGDDVLSCCGTGTKFNLSFEPLDERKDGAREIGRSGILSPSSVVDF